MIEWVIIPNLQTSTYSHDIEMFRHWHNTCLDWRRFEKGNSDFGNKRHIRWSEDLETKFASELGELCLDIHRCFETSFESNGNTRWSALNIACRRWWCNWIGFKYEWRFTKLCFWQVQSHDFIIIAFFDVCVLTMASGGWCAEGWNMCILYIDSQMNKAWSKLDGE